VRQPTLTVLIVVGSTFGRRQQPLELADSKITESSSTARFPDPVIDPPYLRLVFVLELLAPAERSGELKRCTGGDLAQPRAVAGEHTVVAVELPVPNREGDSDPGERERADPEPDQPGDHRPNRTESRTS